MTPGRPVHLVKRFFGSVRARRPSPADQAMVGAVLDGAEARLFWAQPVIDQAHGIATARVVIQGGSGRSELVRAALLHDIGKRHSRLGVIGRSVASAMALCRIPLRGRFARYIDHADVGARELEAIGCSPHIVAFARHHHLQRPAWFNEADWDLLVAADNE